MKIFAKLILLLITVSCSKDEKGILSFHNCKVEYPIYKSGEKELYSGHSVSNKWEFESAKRKLAICLCEEYLKNPNKEAKEKILEIYFEKEEYFSKDVSKNLNLDTILKNRNEIFNPKILID